MSQLLKGEIGHFLHDEHREESKKAETISEIFIILSAYWNYLNYEILEYIVNHCDDISRLECYNEELCEFCKHRLFERIENGGGTDSAPNQKQAK